MRLASTRIAGGGLKRQVKAGLRGVGFELKRYDPEATYPKRRQRLLESERVDVVIDVGAHAGEFGQALRHDGYQGKIVSFEPISGLFERLEALTTADGSWACRRTAVGNQDGEIEIHVSGNDGFSSSVREMAAIHREANPMSSYVGSETVEITTLDRIRDEIVERDTRACLKVDTQGFESEVLAGATDVLKNCRVVELELGFAELYDGQPLFPDLLEEMNAQGFVLTDIEPGFKDAGTQRLLQVDGLFLRSS